MTVKCENARKKDEWIEYVNLLIFNEWVKGDNSLLINKKNKLINDETIHPFIILDDCVPVGCFLIVNNDIKGCPQYTPNLAGVCVQKEYRGKGYSRYILEYSLDELRKMNIEKAYLKTSLSNFYEKVGWKKMNKFYEDEELYEIRLK